MTAVDLTGVGYCTVEDVDDELGTLNTRCSVARIRAAIADATRWIDSLTNRHLGAFAPVYETRYFDWPQDDYSRGYRLYLGDSTLVEAPVSVTSGGVLVQPGDVFAYPARSGPPYDTLELNIGSTEVFSTLATHQRQVAVLGTWGYRPDTRPAGALAEALDSSETAVDVTDSSLVGIGDVVRVDDERLVVTAKGWLSTGQTVITTALTAATTNQAVLVTDGTAVHVDERLLIDSERMRVVDVAGNTLTVQRAIDGTTLAAHSIGATIYAPRTLTVRRGALGTVSATHSSSAALTVHAVEGPVRQLAVAETIEDLLQGASGYAREVKPGSAGTAQAIGTGIDAVRARVCRAYARRVGSRKYAI